MAGQLTISKLSKNNHVTDRLIVLSSSAVTRNIVANYYLKTSKRMSFLDIVGIGDVLLIRLEERQARKVHPVGFGYETVDNRSRNRSENTQNARRGMQLLFFPTAQFVFFLFRP